MSSSRPMMTDAVVRVWHDEEGWGVLDSDQTPGGCWAHHAAIDAEGYRALTPGETVRVTVEHLDVDQDGYRYRALRVER